MEAVTHESVVVVVVVFVVVVAAAAEVVFVVDLQSPASQPAQPLEVEKQLESELGERVPGRGQ